MTAVAILLFGGCDKLFKDDELTMTKTPYTGNELRIDGYYYQMSSVDGSFDDTYFLYRDGIVLSCGGTPLEESPFDFMERLLNGQNVTYQKEKSGWGVFNIQDSTIAIERWYPLEGGLPAGLSEGVILNDTTFLITSLTRMKTGEVYERNDLYHFHAFSPKPDSTNTFIP